MPSSAPNKLFPNQRGFPTPNTAPLETGARLFYIPSDEEWFAILMGALGALRNPYNWYQNGELTQQEAADAFAAIIDAAYENETALTDVPTPYWDEDTDVDDSAPALDQHWYGYVTDPEAPPGELTFVENAAIWAFTGFLAVATWETGAAPALLFNTIAPRFVLATRRGDVGEIIRILVDGEETARVDTTSAAPGELIQTAIVGNPANATHDIMIIQVS